MTSVHSKYCRLICSVTLVELLSSPTACVFFMDAAPKDRLIASRYIFTVLSFVLVLTILLSITKDKLGMYVLCSGLIMRLVRLEPFCLARYSIYG